MIKIKMRKTGKNQRVVAVAEIFLLVVAIFAFSYFIGISIPSVSAQESVCVRTGNSGNLQIMQVPTGSTAQQYCSGLGNAICEQVSCPVLGTQNSGVNPGNTAINAITTVGLTEGAKKILSTESGKIVAHTIQSGETLTEIAQQYGTTVDELLQLNPGIENPDLIVAGENINVPATAEDGATGAAKKGLGALFDPQTAPIGTEAKWGVVWNTLGYLAVNAAVAFGIKGLTNLVFNLAGAESGLATRASNSAGIGYFSGAVIAKGIGLAAGEKGLGFLTGTLLGLPTLGIIGAGIGILYGVLSYKKARYDSVTFSCNPWQAPSGGANCELCNDQEIPCTEYRCKSLGQSCELINRGTDNELCVFQDRDDINPPVIQAWESVLTDGYSYTPDNAVSPPDRGVEIVRDEGDSSCIAPFTPLRFGVALDKNARCKIVTESGRANTFEDMQNRFMTRGLANESHAFQMSLPSHQALAAENISYQHGGEISLYVKCETPQRYSNTADFSFRFCVDEGPDTEEPVVTKTNPINNAPIAFNQPSINASIFINEPAECRWGKLEQNYDDMPAENQLDCPESFTDSTLLGEYRCGAELTGLKSRSDNNFYIGCKDQPWLKGTEEENQRNSNVPFLYTIKGTQPLVLDSVTPNGTTISDSTDIIGVTLEAETSAGFNRGAAVCSSSPADENRFSEFIETGTHKHSQELFLPEGEYSYDIRCVDAGGNADSARVSFNVETDTREPTVVRAFRDSDALKIITNEAANCVYDTVSCSYSLEDGIQMDASNEDRAHSTSWESNRNFFIKCEDVFGNQPNPNQCSIVVRPFDVQ